MGHNQTTIDNKKPYVDNFYNDSDTLGSILPVLEIPLLKQKIQEQDLLIGNILKDNVLTKFKEQYAKASTKHSCYANVWLFTGFISLLTSFWIIISFCFDVDGYFEKMDVFNIGDVHLKFGGEGKSTSPLQTLSASLLFLLIILSMPFYLMITAFKNFRINKHNQIYNKHKELSISTFSTLLESVKADKELKSIIVDRVTSKIFDSPDFGYLKRENDYNAPSMLPSQFLMNLSNLIKNH